MLRPQSRRERNMKREYRRVFIAAVTPVLRAIGAFGRFLRLGSSIPMALRYAWWKSRLAKLGEDTAIRRFVVIHSPSRVEIGSRCSVAEFAHLWGGAGISIGDDVLIASHAIITSLTHDPKAPLFRDSLVRAPVVIGDNVWIGAGAIILPGIAVGSGSIVGAGAVVDRDVPAGAIVVGIPARERGGQ